MEGGGLLGGASTASGPGKPSACGFLGGTHLRQKKGSEKWFWVWGEDLEGGACSDNLYTSGPRPRRIKESTLIYSKDHYYELGYIP